MSEPYCKPEYTDSRLEVSPTIVVELTGNSWRTKLNKHSHYSIAVGRLSHVKVFEGLPLIRQNSHTNDEKSETSSVNVSELLQCTESVTAETSQLEPTTSYNLLCERGCEKAIAQDGKKRWEWKHIVSNLAGNQYTNKTIYENRHTSVQKYRCLASEYTSTYPTSS